MNDNESKNTDSQSEVNNTEVNNIEVNTKCGICLLETWIRPISLTCCGHTYCKKCLENVEKYNSKCPSCKASFNNKISDLTPNVFLCNFIENRIINCEYCEIELQHKNYYEHLRICEKLIDKSDKKHKNKTSVYTETVSTETPQEGWIFNETLSTETDIQVENCCNCLTIVFILFLLFLLLSSLSFKNKDICDIEDTFFLKQVEKYDNITLLLSLKNWKFTKKDNSYKGVYDLGYPDFNITCAQINIENDIIIVIRNIKSFNHKCDSMICQKASFWGAHSISLCYNSDDNNTERGKVVYLTSFNPEEFLYQLSLKKNKIFRNF